DDGVQRGPELVGHGGEEGGLQAIGGLGRVPRQAQLLRAGRDALLEDLLGPLELPVRSTERRLGDTPLRDLPAPRGVRLEEPQQEPRQERGEGAPQQEQWRGERSCDAGGRHPPLLRDARQLPAPRRQGDLELHRVRVEHVGAPPEHGAPLAQAVDPTEGDGEPIVEGVEGRAREQPLELEHRRRQAPVAARASVVAHVDGRPPDDPHSALHQVHGTGDDHAPLVHHPTDAGPLIGVLGVVEPDARLVAGGGYAAVTTLSGAITTFRIRSVLRNSSPARRWNFSSERPPSIVISPAIPSVRWRAPKSSRLRAPRTVSRSARTSSRCASRALRCCNSATPRDIAAPPSRSRSGQRKTRVPPLRAGPVPPRAPPPAEVTCPSPGVVELSAFGRSMRRTSLAWRPASANPSTRGER